MQQASILLWAIPAIFAVLALTFYKVGAMVPAHPSPRWAIVGCLACFVAIVCEALPLRDHPLAYFLTPPAKWVAILAFVRAFRLRHQPDLPLRPALMWFGLCLASHIIAGPLLDDDRLRTFNLMVAALGCLAFALPLMQHKEAEVDRLARLLLPAIAAPMIFRRVAFLLSDDVALVTQAHWGPDIELSYLFTLAIITMIALTLLMAIGRDTVMDREVASTHDPLTGIANRRAFTHWLSESSAAGDLYGTAMMIDLDRFKSLNDKNGHEAGDQALATVAAILASEVGSHGRTARIGGDEFAVVLHSSDELLAMSLANAIHGALDRAALHEMQLTVSIGIACRRSGEMLSDTFRRADDALYQAKNSGRNRVVVADNALETTSPLIPTMTRGAGVQLAAG